MDFFNRLSDDILLKIFSYLTSYELIINSYVSVRFKNISFDKSLIRNTNFSCEYQLSDRLLKWMFTGPISSHIQTLNLNNCYWLKSRTLEVLIARCINLTSLSIIECRLCEKALCKVLSVMKKIHTLEFSVHTMKAFCDEVRNSVETQMVFQRLQNVTVHFQRSTRGVHRGGISINVVQERTFLDYCCCLRKLHVIGAPHSFPQNLIRPLVTKLEQLRTLREIGINAVVDPSARMFFIGVLLEFCKLELPYSTLLMPSANLAQLRNRPEFESCFLHPSSLVNLNLSRSAIDFSVQERRNNDNDHACKIALNELTNLRYLNIAESFSVYSIHLSIISRNCRHLVSLNLSQCNDAVHNVNEELDLSGLEAVAMGCVHLKHLNLSGIHIHQGLTKSATDATVFTALQHITGLQSLALPACAFCTPTTEPHLPSVSKGTKRVLVSYSAPRDFGKRRRVGVPFSIDSGPSTSGEGLSPDAEPTPELLQFTHACPLVTEFELSGANFRSAFNSTFPITPARHSYTACTQAYSVTDFDLAAISSWRNLTSLQLSGLPGISHGQGLVSVAQSCPYLTRLSLSLLGSGAHCSFIKVLCTAFRHLNALKQFRLEQQNLNLNSSFFEAFSQCSSVQRVCVISRNGSYSPEHLEICIQKLPNLCVVQLLTAVSMATSKKLSTKLTKMYLVERPAFHITLLQLLHDDLPDLLRSVPEHHYSDVLLLSSRVASTPVDW